METPLASRACKPLAKLRFPWRSPRKTYHCCLVDIYASYRHEALGLQPMRRWLKSLSPSGEVSLSFICPEICLLDIIFQSPISLSTSRALACEYPAASLLLQQLCSLSVPFFHKAEPLRSIPAWEVTYQASNKRSMESIMKMLGFLQRVDNRCLSLFKSFLIVGELFR